MKIEIKNRFDGKVMFGGEYENIKVCVKAAVNAKADLVGADLGGAYLGGAGLRGADLGGANLGGAKEYSQSHEIMAQLVINHTIKFSVAQQNIAFRIFALRLCWKSIKKEYGSKVRPVFKILADLGWDEYIKYWDEFVKNNSVGE